MAIGIEKSQYKIELQERVLRACGKTAFYQLPYDAQDLIRGRFAEIDSFVGDSMRADFLDKDVKKLSKEILSIIRRTRDEIEFTEAMKPRKRS
ncbi:hypothetical protein KKC94_02335 [Patescibacteria group bacterium]|nr:hypothetical protein [Patescibacteria group bacterium]